MLIEIAAAVSVIAGDQASKAFVLSRPWAAHANTRFLRIRKQLTRRGPLMLALAKPLLVGFWAASAAIAVVLLQTGIIVENALNAASIGAALGGAASNVADRLRREAIVDFIAIGRWPPFNLADAAIVVGVALLVLSFVKNVASATSTAPRLVDTFSLRWYASTCDFQHLLVVLLGPCRGAHGA